MAAKNVVQQIRRATRRQYGAEEKIRIVLEGLRGEISVAQLCRREGIGEVRVDVGQERGERVVKAHALLPMGQELALGAQHAEHIQGQALERNPVRRLLSVIEASHGDRHGVGYNSPGTRVAGKNARPMPGMGGRRAPGGGLTFGVSADPYGDGFLHHGRDP